MEIVGIEPTTVCLQGSLAPLEHASPYVLPDRFELSTNAVSERCATGLRYGRVYGIFKFRTSSFNAERTDLPTSSTVLARLILLCN